MAVISKIREVAHGLPLGLPKLITQTYRVARKLSKYILNVIYLIPAVVLKMFNFRLPSFFVARIGHLLAEPDCYLKEERLDLIPKHRVIMLASRQQVANQAALGSWRQYFKNKPEIS